MGRSNVNVLRMTTWKLASDTESGTTYEEDSLRNFENQLNSVKYTPRIQTAEQYGDGVKVEDYAAKDGGDLDIVIRAYSKGDNAYLFGETEENGTEISNADDIVPYLCLAYMTKRSDGKYNLYKFPKVKCVPQGEESRQQEGTTVRFSTASIKATYSPLLSSKVDCYKRLGVNDKTVIDKWFTEPDYYAPAAGTP